MSNQTPSRVENIVPLIRTIRGEKVLLDSDLARIYGVETRALNQAVKRNISRFPPDFMFQLTKEETKAELRSRSQIVTLKRGMNIKYLPYAFTENGAIMAANVLNSPAAVRMSVFVVRAFVQMRDLLGSTKELARQLADLEKKLTARLDVHESVIVDVLRRVMEILDPPPLPSEFNKQFHLFPHRSRLLFPHKPHPVSLSLNHPLPLPRARGFKERTYLRKISVSRKLSGQFRRPTFQRRGELFSFSPGEKAGMRASVQTIPVPTQHAVASQFDVDRPHSLRYCRRDEENQSEFFERRPGTAGAAPAGPT